MSVGSVSEAGGRFLECRSEQMAQKAAQIAMLVEGKRRGLHHTDTVSAALLRLEGYWRQPAAENQIAGSKMQCQIPEVGTVGRDCAGATAFSRVA